MPPKPFFLFCTVLLISLNASSQLHLRANNDSAFQKTGLSILPQNFYTKHTGFACKAEARLQQQIKLPLFFRLGTKEYVDRLERKPGSYVGRAHE